MVIDLVTLLFAAAVVLFTLAAVGRPKFPSLPVGLACFAGAFLAQRLL